jgi:UDPglucose 6-dehydrogenase
MAAEKGRHPQLLRAVMEINDDRRPMVINRLKEMIGDLNGRVVGLLGLSFKPNTDDMRDAPSISIAELLLKEGASVRAYDPVAMSNAKQYFSQVEMCSDPYSLAVDCDALIVLTEWNEFKNLDLPRLRELMKQPVIMDGRNIYDPQVMSEMGFHYRGMGRGYNDIGLKGKVVGGMVFSKEINR